MYQSYQHDGCQLCLGRLSACVLVAPGGLSVFYREVNSSPKSTDVVCVQLQCCFKFFVVFNLSNTPERNLLQ